MWGENSNDASKSGWDTGAAAEKPVCKNGLGLLASLKKDRGISVEEKAPSQDNQPEKTKKNIGLLESLKEDRDQSSSWDSLGAANVKIEKGPSADAPMRQDTWGDQKQPEKPNVPKTVEKSPVQSGQGLLASLKSEYKGKDPPKIAASATQGWDDEPAAASNQPQQDNAWGGQTSKNPPRDTWTARADKPKKSSQPTGNTGGWGDNNDAPAQSSNAWGSEPAADNAWSAPKQEPAQADQWTSEAPKSKPAADNAWGAPKQEGDDPWSKVESNTPAANAWGSSPKETPSKKNVTFEQKPDDDQWGKQTDSAQPAADDAWGTEAAAAPAQSKPDDAWGAGAAAPVDDAWGTSATNQLAQNADGGGAWGTEPQEKVATPRKADAWGVEVVDDPWFNQKLDTTFVAAEDSNSEQSVQGLMCPKYLTNQLLSTITQLKQTRISLSQLTAGNEIEEGEYSPLHLMGVVREIINATEDGEYGLKDAQGLIETDNWADGQWTDYAESEFSGRETFSQVDEDEEKKSASADVEMNDSFSSLEQDSSGVVSPRGFDSALFVSTASMPLLEVLQHGSSNVEIAPHALPPNLRHPLLVDPDKTLFDLLLADQIPQSHLRSKLQEYQKMDLVRRFERDGTEYVMVIRRGAEQWIAQMRKAFEVYLVSYLPPLILEQAMAAMLSNDKFYGDQKGDRRWFDSKKCFSMRLDCPKDPTPALERHYFERRMDEDQAPPQNLNFIIVDRDEHSWPNKFFNRLVLVKTFAPMTSHLNQRDRMIERFPLKISQALKSSFAEQLPQNRRWDDLREHEATYYSTFSNKLWLVHSSAQVSNDISLAKLSDMLVPLAFDHFQLQLNAHSNNGENMVDINDLRLERVEAKKRSLLYELNLDNKTREGRFRIPQDTKQLAMWLEEICGNRFGWRKERHSTMSNMTPSDRSPGLHSQPGGFQSPAGSMGQGSSGRSKEQPLFVRDNLVSDGGKQAIIDTIFNKILNHSVVERRVKKTPKLNGAVQN